MNYKKLYYQLFSACADATQQLEEQNYGKAREILIAAQQAAEEAFLSANEPKDEKK